MILQSSAICWLTSKRHWHRAVSSEVGIPAGIRLDPPLSSSPEAGRAMLCARHPYDMFCTWDWFTSRTNHSVICADRVTHRGWMSDLWNAEGKSGELASSFPHFSKFPLPGSWAPHPDWPWGFIGVRLESSSDCHCRDCSLQLAEKTGLQRDKGLLTRRKSSPSISSKANPIYVENKETAGWVMIFNTLKRYFLKRFFYLKKFKK